jgi:hypothetical protein
MLRRESKCIIDRCASFVGCGMKEERRLLSEVGGKRFQCTSQPARGDRYYCIIPSGTISPRQRRRRQSRFVLRFCLLKSSSADH